MKGRERETVRRTDSVQMRKRKNKCGKKINLTGRQIKEGERVVEEKKKAEIGAVCHSLSPLLIITTHRSSSPALRLSSPCLYLCLSLFSDSLLAPLWFWLKAEVVSITALQTHGGAWFGSSVCHSVWATASGCELTGPSGRAGHRGVSVYQERSCLLETNDSSRMNICRFRRFFSFFHQLRDMTQFLYNFEINP